MDSASALMAIGHYLPRDRRCFKRGREDYEAPPRQGINDFFYEQRTNFPELTNNWIFTEGDHIPTSVDQAISNLYGSGLLVVSSNHPWHYHFSSLCDVLFEMRTKKRPAPAGFELIGAQQESRLQELTKRFEEKVACPIIFEC